MDYRLNVETQTYPVEDLRLPPAVTLAEHSAGRSPVFISPVKLPLGKHCALVSPAGGFNLEVQGCFGFVYSLKYLVTGRITDQWASPKLNPATA